MLDGFEPLDDALDRRLLYEVTGFKLNQYEFKGEDSDSLDSHEQPDSQVSDVPRAAIYPTVNSDSDSDQESQDDKEDLIAGAKSD